MIIPDCVVVSASDTFISTLSARGLIFEVIYVLFILIFVITLIKRFNYYAKLKNEIISEKLSDSYGTY